MPRSMEQSRGEHERPHSPNDRVYAFTQKLFDPSNNSDINIHTQLPHYQAITISELTDSRHPGMLKYGDRIFKSLEDKLDIQVDKKFPVYGVMSLPKIHTDFIQVNNEIQLSNLEDQFYLFKDTKGTTQIIHKQEWIQMRNGKIPKEYTLLKDDNDRTQFNLDIARRYNLDSEGGGDIDGALQEMARGVSCYSSFEDIKPPKGKIISSAQKVGSSDPTNREPYQSTIVTTIILSPAGTHMETLIGYLDTIAVKKNQPTFDSFLS